MRRQSRGQVIAAFFAAAACLTAVDAASAQSQSLFGNRGPASQIGSNAAGAPVGGNFNTGRVTAGGTGGGRAGGASGTLGLSGQPVGGGQGANQAGSAAGGAIGTQEGFVGRDDNANRFVGDQRVGQQTGATQRGQGGRQFGNRTGGGGATGRAFGETDRDGGRGGNQRSRPIVRPRHEVAFTYDRPAPSEVASSLNAQLEKIAIRRPGLENVEVVIDARGTATLRGRVDSADARKLAALMVRLEPGVRSIENELTVGE